MRAWQELVVFGVGHSTRPIEELVGLLWENGVVTLADVRHHPGSRKNPQFNPGPLEASLKAAGLRYVQIPELGGRRSPRADSPNGGWRNESFRGYADHLGTREAARGLARLHALAAEGPVAMMCAEAVPWRCHRSLLADLLLARGCTVTQIFGPGQTRAHRMTPFARVVGDRVFYPPEPSHPEEHPG